MQGLPGAPSTPLHRQSPGHLESVVPWSGGLLRSYIYIYVDSGSVDHSLNGIESKTSIIGNAS